MGTINDLIKETTKNKAEQQKINSGILKEAEKQLYRLHARINDIILNKFEDASINPSDLENNVFAGTVSARKDEIFDSLSIAKFYLNENNKEFNATQRFQRLFAAIASFKVLNKAYGSKNYTKLKKIISKINHRCEYDDDKIENDFLNVIKDIANLDEKQKFTVVFSNEITDEPYISDIEITYHDFKLFVNFRGIIPEGYYLKEEDDDEENACENPFNKIRATFKTKNAKKPLTDKDKKDIVDKVVNSFGDGIKDFKSRVKVIDMSSDEGIKEAAEIIDDMFGGFEYAAKKFKDEYNKANKDK